MRCKTLFTKQCRTFGICPGFAQRGLCFGNGGAGFGQFALYGVAGNARQQLAALDAIANIGTDLGDPVVADFRANDRLLPGRYITAGLQCLRPVEQLWCGCRDGQRRLGGKNW